MENIIEMFEPLTSQMQELEVEKIKIEESVKTSQQQLAETMQLYEEKRLKLYNLQAENASLMRLHEQSTTANTKIFNRTQKTYGTVQKLTKVFNDTSAIMQLRLSSLKDLESINKELEENLIKYNNETELERMENMRQIDYCMKEIESLKQESEDNAKRFEETLKEKRDKIDAKVKHINELKDILRDEENITKSLTEKRDAIFKEKESLVSELLQLEINSKEMFAKNENDLTELNIELSALTVTDRNNKHLFNKLKAEKETLKTGLEEHNALLKSIKMENIKLKETSDNLDININNRKIDIEKLEIQIQNENENFKNEIEENNCQSLEEENVVLTEDVQSYIKNIAAWEIMIEDSKNLLEKDKSYYEEFESELNKMRENRQDDVIKFETTINELKTKLQEEEMLQNEIMEQQSKLKSDFNLLCCSIMEAFEKEIGTLETNYNTLEREFTDGEIEMNLVLDKLKHEKQLLKSQLTANKKALKKIETESKKKKEAALKKQKTTLEEKAKELEEEIKMLETERNIKKKQNDEALKKLANENTTEELRNSELQSSIDNILRELKIQQQQLEKQKLEASNNKKSEFKLPENKIPASKYSSSSIESDSSIDKRALLQTRKEYLLKRKQMLEPRNKYPQALNSKKSNLSNLSPFPPVPTQQSFDQIFNSLRDEDAPSLPKPAKKAKRGGRRKVF